MSDPSPDPEKLVEIDRTPTPEEEERDFENEDDRSKRIKNDSDAQDMSERIRYADNAYGITQAWIGFLIVLTIGQFALKPIGVGLEKSEFITVFTTTTASVFGFWLLVGQYLFRSPVPPKKKDAAKGPKKRAPSA